MSHLPLVVLLAIACGRGTPRPDPPPPVPSPLSATPVDDTIPTAEGPLRVDPRTHATLRLEHAGRSIWVDPWSKADLSGPKADLVLVTDVHHDHLDPAAVDAVRKEGTVVVAPPAAAEKLAPDVVLANGETWEVAGLRVTAVPMYNLERGPEPGRVYHEKGRGNGYLLELGGVRVYIAGDTECTPEMRSLEGVDVAFVPMKLPYTMSVDEAADCILDFRPKVVYPYHYGDADLQALRARLAGAGDVELRVREWYPQGSPF